MDSISGSRVSEVPLLLGKYDSLESLGGSSITRGATCAVLSVEIRSIVPLFITSSSGERAIRHIVSGAGREPVRLHCSDKPVYVVVERGSTDQNE